MELRQTYSSASIAILALAFPLILTNFAYVALTTIDIIVLGKLGTLELAAGGLAIALFNQFKTTSTGLVTGLSNLVAEEKVTPEQPNDRHYQLLSAGICLAVIASLVSIGCLMLIKQPLLWIGQQPDVVDMAMSFLFIIAPGMFPALLIQVFRHFTTGLKRPGPMLLMTILSVGVSILSNYSLVFGHLGSPALGLIGVAISTVITLLFSLIVFYGFLLRDDVVRPYLKLSKFSLDIETINTLFKLGLPIAVTYAAEAGFFTVLALIVGTLSVEALAVQNVIAQIIYIVFMIPAGFSHAASVFISGAFAEKQWEKVKIHARSAIGITLLICLFIGGVYWVCPQLILPLFIESKPDDSVYQLMVTGLMFASVLQIFDALQNIGTGLLRGLGDTVSAMKWSMLGYWLVGIPVSWLLGVAFSFDIYGVWIGLGLGLALTGFALLLIFEKRLRTHE